MTKILIRGDGIVGFSLFYLLKKSGIQADVEISHLTKLTHKSFGFVSPSCESNNPDFKKYLDKSMETFKTDFSYLITGRSYRKQNGSFVQKENSFTIQTDLIKLRAVKKYNYYDFIIHTGKNSFTDYCETFVATSPIVIFEPGATYSIPNTVPDLYFKQEKKYLKIGCDSDDIVNICKKELGLKLALNCKVKKFKIPQNTNRLPTFSVKNNIVSVGNLGPHGLLKGYAIAKILSESIIHFKEFPKWILNEN